MTESSPVHERAMPCERCGDLIAVGVVGEGAVDPFWSEGLIEFLCQTCHEATGGAA